MCISYIPASGGDNINPSKRWWGHVPPVNYTYGYTYPYIMYTLWMHLCVCVCVCVCSAPSV